MTDRQKVIDPMNWVIYREKFATDEMREIWSEDSILEKRLRCEVAVAKAEAELGIIPHTAALELERKATLEYVTPERCLPHYLRTGHDIISMLKVLEEACADDAGQWAHYGLTTQDILDSAQALALKETYSILLRDLLEIEAILLSLAQVHKKTVMAGRPHAQHGVPTTFGLKVATWAAELTRGIDRLQECAKRLLAGNFTGAVGTYAAFNGRGMEVEQRALSILGLAQAEICTHTTRDRLAEFLCDLAIIGGTFERIGNEIWQLQKQEIYEVATPFRVGEQIDSSTMAQKRNPLGVDHWKGFAKILRGNALSMLEVSMEHERDATRLPAEQSAIPQSCANLAAVLAEAKGVLGGLQVFPENMRRNMMSSGGYILSEAVIYALARKTGRKQEAHDLMYRVSQAGISEGKTLKEALFESTEVMALLTAEELEHALDPERHVGEAAAAVEKIVWAVSAKRKQGVN